MSSQQNKQELSYLGPGGLDSVIYPALYRVLAESRAQAGEWEL